MPDNQQTQAFSASARDWRKDLEDIAKAPDLYSEYFPEQGTKIASASKSNGDLYSEYFPGKRDWRSELEDVAANNPMQLTGRAVQSVADALAPAYPAMESFLAPARQAVQQQQAYRKAGDTQALNRAAYFSGLANVADAAINFIPGMAQQAANVPPQQRWHSDLAGAVLKSNNDWQHAAETYPEAFRQRQSLFSFAAPQPTSAINVLKALRVPGANKLASGVASGGIRANAINQALVGGTVANALGMNDALKQGRDYSLPEAALNTAFGAGVSGAMGAGGAAIGKALARARQATPLAQPTDHVSSSPQLDAIDADLAAALGIKQKPNAMKTATQFNDLPHVQIQQQMQKRAKQAAQELDGMLKANIARADKAERQLAQKKLVGRIEAHRKWEASPNALKAATQLEVLSRRQADALEALVKPAPVTQEVRQTAAEALTDAALAEKLDAAIAYPLSFQTFKDAGITWAPNQLTDAQLATYANKFRGRANVSTGGIKRQMERRAEALNQEIARRAAMRNEGSQPTVPDAIPDKPVQQLPQIRIDRAPVNNTRPVKEYVPDPVMPTAQEIQRTYEVQHFPEAMKPLAVEKAYTSTRKDGYYTEARATMPSELPDESIASHMQELKSQLSAKGVTAWRKQRIADTLEALKQEVARRANRRSRGWDVNWEAPDRNIANVTQEELERLFAEGTEAQQQAAANEFIRRDAMQAEALATTSNAQLQQLGDELAAVAAQDTLTPKQADEYARLSHAASAEAKARKLPATTTGTLPLAAAVQAGLLDEAAALRAQDLAHFAYREKLTEKQMRLLERNIMKRFPGQDAVTLDGYTFKRNEMPDAPNESQLAFTRQASQELEDIRALYGKEVGREDAGHLQTELSPTAYNLLHTEYDGRASVGELLDAWKTASAEYKHVTSTKGGRKKLSKTGGKPRYLNARQMAAEDTLPAFQAAKQAYEASNPGKEFKLEIPVGETQDGEAITVTVKYVEPAVKRVFEDEMYGHAIAAKLKELVQRQEAWLKKPVTVLSPTQKAKLALAFTSLGMYMHGAEAKAAGLAGELVDAPTIWQAIGTASPEILIASALSGAVPGVNKVNQYVARNLLEGKLGMLRDSLVSPVLLGRSIRLADLWRNTRDRVQALTRLVPDEDGILAYQQRMTAEYYKLSAQLKGVQPKLLAEAMHEIKHKLVTPEEALNGSRANSAWRKLAPQQRETLLYMRALQNSIGNKLTAYGEKVDTFLKAAQLVEEGIMPLAQFNQLEGKNRSLHVREVREKRKLIEELRHSLWHQIDAANPPRNRDGYLDKGYRDALANFNEFYFGASNYAFQFMTLFDNLVLGTSYAGARNMALAASDRAMNAQLNATLKAIQFVGERSADIQGLRAEAAARDMAGRSAVGKVVRAADKAIEAIGSAVPKHDRERINAEELALAVIYRHFHKNQKHFPGLNRQAYAQKVLTWDATIGEATLINAWNEVTLALEEVHAVSPFQLSTNLVSESSEARRVIGWFVKQPAREARLVMSYMAKGDWKALLTFYAMKAAVAGSAAVPVELGLLMGVGSPDGNDKLNKLLDKLSIYNALDPEGTTTPKLRWSAALWPLMGGRTSPFLGPAESLAKLAKSKMNELAKDGDITWTGEDARKAGSALLPFLPNKGLPVKGALDTIRAMQEVAGKDIEAYPRNPLMPAWLPPDFKGKETTSVRDIYAQAQPGSDTGNVLHSIHIPPAVGEAIHILKQPFTPTRSKFERNVQQRYEREKYEEAQDALAQFLAKQVTQR